MLAQRNTVNLATTSITTGNLNRGEESGYFAASTIRVPLTSRGDVMQGNVSHFPLKSRYAILPVKREGWEEEAQLVDVSMTVAVNQGNGDSGMTSPHGDTGNNFFMMFYSYISDIDGVVMGPPPWWSLKSDS